MLFSIVSLSFLMSCSGLQHLEKENTRLELEMEEILRELNHQKDHNNLMCDKVAQLEMGLKHSKVLPLFV